MVRPVRPVPRDLTQHWPVTSSDDVRGEAARLFAANLTTALGGASVRQAKTMTGVNHSTIAAILAGTTWPDMATIARLEASLKARLWPTISDDGHYLATPEGSPDLR